MIAITKRYKCWQRAGQLAGCAEARGRQPTGDDKTSGVGISVGQNPCWQRNGGMSFWTGNLYYLYEGPQDGAFVHLLA